MRPSTRNLGLPDTDIDISLAENNTHMFHFLDGSVNDDFEDHMDSYAEFIATHKGSLSKNTLIENVKGLKEIFEHDYKKVAGEQIELIKEISLHIAEINSNITAMIDERKKANKLEGQKAADAYCNQVKPYFDKIRYHCDKLEIMIDDELWPLTKYRELLFTK